ncbi:MAG TPA: putative DNA-binding domain-containing protein [Sphingomicrobium sp.]|nr:putative DNA-binding domain-containing protein [Sphingomicrobium sp.]
MQPDALTEFHQAVRFGPAHCPSDLFAGSAPAIVRGLKVHANNIAHARHVALADTYPRLRKQMGTESFDALAGRFLDSPAVLDRSLDGLGQGLDALVEDPRYHDLARAEWAWLQAFHAAERQPLSLADLGMMNPEKLLRASFGLHPATHIVAIERPGNFLWDEPIAGDGDCLLITRPDANVCLRWVGPAEAEIVTMLERRQSAADLLGGNPASLLALIEAGAIYLGDRL